MTNQETRILFNKLKKKAHISKANLLIYNSDMKDVDASTNIITRTIRVSKASLLRLSPDEMAALLGHELGHIYYSKRNFIYLLALLIADVICEILSIMSLYITNPQIVAFIDALSTIVIILNFFTIRHLHSKSNNASKVAIKFGSNAHNGKEIRADLFSVRLVGANNNINLFKFLRKISNQNSSDNKEYIKKSRNLSLIPRLHVKFIQKKFKFISKIQNKVDPHPSLTNRIKIIREYAINDLHQNPDDIQDVNSDTTPTSPSNEQTVND